MVTFGTLAGVRFSFARSMFARSRRAAYAALVALAGAHGSASAQVIHFVRTTDTIRVPIQTTFTNATFEARVLIPVEGTPPGTLYHEQFNAVEDKLLSCIGGVVQGIAWTSAAYNGRPTFAASPPIADGLWHHVAFVRDGNQERFYLDGALVYSETWSEAIANSASSGPLVIGAGQFSYYYGAPLVHMDWLRLSNTARYSGASAPPPTCEPAADANTVILFLFNQPPGSAVAIDSGPSAAHGTLGVGFASATSPEFEDHPSANGRPSFTQPIPLVVCSSGDAEFSVDVVEPGSFGYQWQWQEVGEPGVWTNVVNGPNSDSDGVERFDASGAAAAAVSLSPDGLPGGSLGVIDAVRCVVNNACGTVTSQPAALTVEGTPCCPADWNGDGVTNSTDVSDFINDWFTDQAKGTLIADWDGNGVVNSTDVSEFINSWFEDTAGGCG